MKRKLKLLIVVILIPISLETYFHIILKKVAPKHHPTEYPANTKRFLNAIARLESGGDPKIVSSTGYLGKYQFSPTTLHNIGFNMSDSAFLNNSDIQDSAMVTYMRRNQSSLYKYIRDCSNYHIGDVTVTLSGILAGAHTHGPGAVILFITSNGEFNASDGNGVLLSTRMKQFEHIILKRI